MGICTICFPYSVFYLGTISSVAESKNIELNISGNKIKKKHWQEELYKKQLIKSVNFNKKRFIHCVNVSLLKPL